VVVALAAPWGYQNRNNEEITMIKTLSMSKKVGTATLIATALMLGACASKPKAPTESITAAEQSVAFADAAHAAEFAPVELAVARQKLSEARVQMEKDEMIYAERLANQAKLDAELATAKAEAAKAKKVNEELQKGNQILKEELDRSTNTGTGAK
jgi:hypothetical protein